MVTVKTSAEVSLRIEWPKNRERFYIEMRYDLVNSGVPQSALLSLLDVLDKAGQQWAEAQ